LWNLVTVHSYILPLTTCTTWRRISRHAQRGAFGCCQITDEGWSHGWHALLHR